jgi:hypothetical protein
MQNKFLKLVIYYQLPDGQNNKNMIKTFSGEV